MSRFARLMLAAAAIAICLHSSVVTLWADEAKAIKASATGQIIAVAPCPAPIFCQTTVVAGTATRFGPLTGELNERVDTTTGQYSGTAVFSFPGGTLSTTYTGQVTSQDPTSGNVTFVEHHTITGGTGRLLGTTGYFDLTGSADAGGAVAVTGTGVAFN